MHTCGAGPGAAVVGAGVVGARVVGAGVVGAGVVGVGVVEPGAGVVGAGVVGAGVVATGAVVGPGVSLTMTDPSLVEQQVGCPTGVPQHPVLGEGQQKGVLLLKV